MKRCRKLEYVLFHINNIIIKDRIANLCTHSLAHSHTPNTYRHTQQKDLIKWYTHPHTHSHEKNWNYPKNVECPPSKDIRGATPKEPTAEGERGWAKLNCNEIKWFWSITLGASDAKKFNFPKHSGLMKPSLPENKNKWTTTTTKAPNCWPYLNKMQNRREKYIKILKKKRNGKFWNFTTRNSFADCNPRQLPEWACKLIMQMFNIYGSPLTGQWRQSVMTSLEQPFKDIGSGIDIKLLTVAAPHF